MTLTVAGPQVEMCVSHTQPHSVILLIHFTRGQLKATLVLPLSRMKVRFGCILLCTARLEFTPSAQETRNVRHDLSQSSWGLVASAWRPT